VKTISEADWAISFARAPVGTSRRSYLRYPPSISPTAGAARFPKMNTRGATSNEPMPKKGSRVGTIDAAGVSIVVKAPIANVYKRWLAFEDYPKFITVVKRVRKLDANHFVASLGFNGKQYDTTLELMLCVPERRLAWRTLADHHAPDHFAAGVVSFAALSDQSTCVTLKLTSSFGGAVSSRVDKYLHNFKTLVEGQGDR